MDKFRIGIDFEGIKDELSKYDDMIIEAEDEDDADIKVMKMLEKDKINLPYFSITNEEKNG
tara:strand:+ start:268 stop:450 length:183 start_codon:yes stop_codon:yes gene_type:complete